MIHSTPFFLPWLYPSLIWRVSTVEKVLYLTFDDGPVPGPTEFVLHTLARFSAKATFFCIGDNIRKYPEIFKQIVEDGHAIGNHTFNHVKGWGTTKDNYVVNTKLCDEQIEINNGSLSYAKLFRPPYGRISRKQIKALSEYKIVMWDVLSIDYSRIISPISCLNNTIKATREGSIIVFHDSYKAEKNMAYTLPRFIEHFSELGFTFKALS